MKNGHVLYDASDFTDEEYYSGNTIAVLVIDGGLSVCKLCGAAYLWPKAHESTSALDRGHV